MNGVSEKPMINVIKHLKEKYNSVMGYINDILGISDKDIDALKEKFLI